MAIGRSVVVLTPGGGHARRLLSVVAGLRARDIDVHVMTRPEVRAAVEAAGGTFVDLFARFPIDAVDRESLPFPSRFVTFAAAYVEPLAADIARLNPALIVYDSFMVVAPLVGRRLGIPYVSMRAGHAQVPGPAIAAIAAEPSVAISAACLDAVRRLRDEHGLEDATPFAYLAGVSPHLNLYPEPSQYLDAGQAAAFAPIAFFGSLTLHRAAEAVPIFPGSGLKNVYVSFGTAVWRYYADSALGAMGVLADAAAASDVEMVISLGGYDAESTARHRIGRRHVRVETYVDQEAALREADIFVTHHGLNSTHEAAFQGVPMLSYPFFGDQPSMAACCQSLGFAMPLSSGLRQPLDLQGVVDRFQAVVAHRQELTARLRQAREWELDVMESRASVIDRMLALAD